jgi:hypothetical protein
VTQKLTSVRIVAEVVTLRDVASRLEKIEHSLRYIEGQLRIIVAIMAIEDTGELEPIPERKEAP